ncbi:hypothetical protein TIFTF001_014184 [Ficus carica]|uniref:Uncharacterized protein n=1 Tax=Ficus carica TaxID=3494 RepID=A0AA88D7X6_FICCA|nr:hypothetical protein TIFTF001_014184 [Ficus carica]
MQIRDEFQNKIGVGFRNKGLKSDFKTRVGVGFWSWVGVGFQNDDRGRVLVRGSGQDSRIRMGFKMGDGVGFCDGGQDWVSVLESRFETVVEIHDKGQGRNSQLKF